MKLYPHHDQLFFYGATESPFLAPRGVFISPLGHLIVSDTGQNRIFIWNRIPNEAQVAPDVVIGQSDTIQTGRNNDFRNTGMGLQYPSGIWSDGKRLAIADAWNHRVLLWHQLPGKDGQAADVVLGQESLFENKPNRKGLGHKPEANTLYWPYGVWCEGSNLWIADTGNRRLLYFNQWPTQHGFAAQSVLGQADFNSREFEPAFFTWPYAMSISELGQLAVSDTQSYRVGIWSHWQDASKQTADYWLGQNGQENAEPNRNRALPGADTLYWNYHCCFYRNGLWVADTANSRVLYFKDQEKTARYFLGTNSIQSSGEFDTQNPENKDRMYWPFCLSQQGNRLAVADTGNHRIIIYTLLDP